MDIRVPIASTLSSRHASASACANLSLLRRATATAPVVLLGGDVRRAKLDAIRSRLGLRIEWLESTRWRTLPGRIALGTVSAVVFLDGLLGHPAQRAVLAATRAHGAPVEYAHRGGVSSIDRALAALEHQLLLAQSGGAR